MAITSMDQLVFALATGEHRHFDKGSLFCNQLQFISRMASPGIPGPGLLTLSGAANGVIPTQTLAGALLRFTNPSGSNTLYLAQLTLHQFQSGASAETSLWFLYDRLFHAGSFNGTTTSITITAPPALTRPDSTGTGAELWVEVATATTTAQTITVTYTNAAGVGSRTATGPIAAGALAGQMSRCNLAAGDTGIQSIQSYTLSGSLAAGTINLLILRRITACFNGPSQNGILVPMNTMALGLPVIYPDAFVQVVSLPNNNSATDRTIGSATLVQG